MEESTQDAPEVLETPVEPVEETVELEKEPEPQEAQTDEEKEALRKENDELKRKNAQLFERTKKQKELIKENDGLSNKDVLFLAKVDIHEDDIDEVLEWAKFKKITVNDAYKQLKDTLDVRTEQRKTAASTQTRGSARGASKVSGVDLLAKAYRTGEVPETDEGMQELFKARLAERLQTKKS